MASLANKTALVTGASRGIGRATAEALARAGAHLIVHYGRAAAEADTLVAGIRAAGGRADAASAARDQRPMDIRFVLGRGPGRCRWPHHDPGAEDHRGTDEAERCQGEVGRLKIQREPGGDD